MSNRNSCEALPSNVDPFRHGESYRTVHIRSDRELGPRWQST